MIASSHENNSEFIRISKQIDIAEAMINQLKKEIDTKVVLMEALLEKVAKSTVELRMLEGN